MTGTPNGELMTTAQIYCDALIIEVNKVVVA
jgi:hypothetical protein